MMLISVCSYVFSVYALKEILERSFMLFFQYNPRFLEYNF